MTGDVAKLTLRDVDTSLSFENRTWHLHQPEGYVTFFELPILPAIKPPRNSKTGKVGMKRHLFTYGSKVAVHTSGTSNARTKPKILGSVPVEKLRLTFDGTWTYLTGGGGKIFVHSGRCMTWSLLRQPLPTTSPHSPHPTCKPRQTLRNSQPVDGWYVPQQ